VAPLRSKYSTVKINVLNRIQMQMPSVRLLLVTAIVVAILAYFAILVSGGGFNQDGFADLGKKQNIFTLYYMDGCPHCERIMPDYKKFAAAGQFASNGKKTTIRALEQGDPSAAPELEANNVSGFPTFILSTADGKNIEYQGDRTVAAMQAFIKKNAV
jgi:thiol-disulfide isomerase/thioredoxin